MTAPKRIYLELNNVPPCNFGALWYDAEVHDPLGENCAAYVLESAVQEEIRLLKSQIAGLEQTVNELSIEVQQANARIETQHCEVV